MRPERLALLALLLPAAHAVRRLDHVLSSEADEFWDGVRGVEGAPSCLEENSTQKTLLMDLMDEVRMSQDPTPLRFLELLMQVAQHGNRLKRGSYGLSQNSPLNCDVCSVSQKKRC